MQCTVFIISSKFCWAECEGLTGLHQLLRARHQDGWLSLVWTLQTVFSTWMMFAAGGNSLLVRWRVKVISNNIS